MVQMSASIEPLLEGLASDPRLPRSAREDIRHAISESPWLMGLIATGAKDGRIGHIAVSYGENNAGHFQDGEDGKDGVLYVSASVFKIEDDKERLDRLTETMGHEAMHGVLGGGFGVDLWIYRFGTEEASLKDCVYGVRFHGDKT